MTAHKLLTLPFRAIDKHDIPLVGGKGANLGEMTKAGFPVPPGFAVTVLAYDMFLDENNMRQEVNKLMEGIDVHNTEELQRVSLQLQKKVIKGKIPEAIFKAVVKDYEKLSGKLKKSLVAVRSSATAEDLPSASFAGQQATFLNIKGEANLLNAVRECWASLFTPRAIFYRNENKIDHLKVKISVIVQKMVQSTTSGVMFTIDPVTNDKDRIIVEAVWGLGEMIVQGSVTPDTFVVQKDTFALLSKQISDQSVQLIKKGTVTKEIAVPSKLIGKQKISDEDVVKLAKIADALQKHYYFPQDIEWAKEGKNLYIVQTRPVTTMKVTKQSMKDKAVYDPDMPTAPILTGASASPGIGTGTVRIVLDAKNVGKVKSGDVLVSVMTSPDFVPAMKKASAIVTDEGGQTSHAAIVSRELGVPCVVGTKQATKLLKDDLAITVDGSKGMVFLGGRAKGQKVVEVKEEIIKEKSATKIYINLAEPQLAAEAAKMNVEGVGLLRAEFIIADIGIHPKEAIKLKVQDKFVDKLTLGLKKFCREFHPRPVVYRATDFKTNEYRHLTGGKAWEPVEPNPMLGFRGAYRYIADPEVFTLELRAIKRVREEFNNLWIMIPFVRSPQELAAVRRIVEAENLFEPTFKFWMMVELPVNVIMLEEFIKVGIDGVSIGSNDLTMLISGTDRDNAEVAQAFDERSPAVLWALRRTIKTCNKFGVSSSICGQAPSTYEDLVEKLVNYGITSISANPDAVNRVRRIVMAAEKKLATK